MCSGAEGGRIWSCHETLWNGTANDIIEHFRELADGSGTGYQTEINRALRQYLARSGQPVTLEAVRQVIREELQAS
jgi:hypothetical protein